MDKFKTYLVPNAEIFCQGGASLHSQTQELMVSSAHAKLNDTETEIIFTEAKVYWIGSLEPIAILPEIRVGIDDIGSTEVIDYSKLPEVTNG